jgi:hypothetical protein
VIEKMPGPTVNARQRQLMQYLRSGKWVLVSKLPVSASPVTLNRIVDYGWIERRGGGPRSEIKLTPAGLVALQTPI